jgi:hypothetical protein
VILVGIMKNKQKRINHEGHEELEEKSKVQKRLKYF